MEECEITGKKKLGKTSNPNTCLFEHKHLEQDLEWKGEDETKIKGWGAAVNFRFHLPSSLQSLLIIFPFKHLVKCTKLFNLISQSCPNRINIKHHGLLITSIVIWARTHWQTHLQKTCSIKIVKIKWKPLSHPIKR